MFRKSSMRLGQMSGESGCYEAVKYEIFPKWVRGLGLSPKTCVDEIASMPHDRGTRASISRTQLEHRSHY